MFGIYDDLTKDHVPGLQKYDMCMTEQVSGSRWVKIVGRHIATAPNISETDQSSLRATCHMSRDVCLGSCRNIDRRGSYPVKYAVSRLQGAHAPCSTLCPGPGLGAPCVCQVSVSDACLAPAANCVLVGNIMESLRASD